MMVNSKSSSVRLELMVEILSDIRKILSENREMIQEDEEEETNKEFDLDESESTERKTKS